MSYIPNESHFKVAFDGREVEYHLASECKITGRPIVHLNPVSWTRNLNEFEAVLKDLGFSPGAINKIYMSLGNENLENGKDVLAGYINSGKITVERVGCSKEKHDDSGTKVPSEDKFYLMINEVTAKGGNNEFHIAFSRKGTARGVSRGANAPKLAQDLSASEYYDVFPRHCSRIMNYENKIKITELGSKGDLSKFPIENLSRKQRLTLYRTILQGLAYIHKFGVHGDFKPLNIVATKDNTALIIDFDTLKGTKDKQPFSGTYCYFSIERMASFINGREFIASEQDDLWAAMMTICELERKVSPENQLISPNFMKKYEEFKGFLTNPTSELQLFRLTQTEKRKKLCQEAINCIGFRDNLFDNEKPDPNYMLDPLVYDMAHISMPKERPHALLIAARLSRLEIECPTPEEEGKLKLQKNKDTLTAFFDGDKKELEKFCKKHDIDVNQLLDVEFDGLKCCIKAKGLDYKDFISSIQITKSKFLFLDDYSARIIEIERL